MKRAKPAAKPEKPIESKPAVPVGQRVVGLLPILCIVAGAAVLRFYGLRWGLPNGVHDYSYHPDEFLTVLYTYVNIVQNGSLDPRFYNYPSLYLYLVAAAMFTAFGYVPTVDQATLYLSARIVTVLMGTAAVLAVYWAAGKLTSKTGALAAAVIVAIAPLHVQHSHFATVDVPCTLFVALALGFSFLTLKNDNWRWYIFAGLMSGLAAGTKYNAGLVFLTLVAAHFWGRGKAGLGPRSLAKPLVALVMTMVAFVITTPSVFLNPAGVMSALKYEAIHTSTGHGLVFVGTGNGFLYTFTTSLWYGLGPCLAVLFLGSLVLATARRNKAMLVVLAFLIPYYALISISQVRFARYALPMFPAIAIVIGWMFAEVWESLRTRTMRARVMASVAAAILILATLGYTVALDRLFGLSDPRDRAAAWIKANVPAGSFIGVIDYPWFYSPPLSNMFGFGKESDRAREMTETPFTITAMARQGVPVTPPVSILSDYEIQDALRLRSDKRMGSGEREQVDSIVSAVDSIKKSSTQAAEFSNTLQCCGISFGSTQALPHDMRYVSPTITIYRRGR